MAQQPASNSATAGFWKEFESWKTPEAREVAAVPEVGSRAPSSDQLRLPDGRPTLVVFLRHCGCPFAEKTFKTLTALSGKYDKVHCVAVSHSSAAATDQWLPQVGGTWAVDMTVDEQRLLYAQWGLGISSTWHVVNPLALYSVFRLGKDEGIWNRPTDSGSRWQMGGAFAVDSFGVVRWAHVAASADDMPDLEAGIKALGVEPSEAPKKGTFTLGIVLSGQYGHEICIWATLNSSPLASAVHLRAATSTLDMEKASRMSLSSSSTTKILVLSTPFQLSVFRRRHGQFPLPNLAV
ncbi:hypothetical protein G7046_g2263 [Stylonectria norvegica]|nr:hypothetical protein G7046_g2263 [Stylonectria norvegica]